MNPRRFRFSSLIIQGLYLVLLVCLSTWIIQEMKYSRYSRAKVYITHNILTLNPIINPASITNQFVFLPNVDLYQFVKRFTDNFIDEDVLRYSGPQSVYVERKVDVCVSGEDDVFSSNHWTPVPNVTKYTPDLDRIIYSDIKIGNFYIDESLFDGNSKMRTLKLDYKEIYKNFVRPGILDKKGNKFVYTYIGDGWFYHMNKGNVTQFLRSREYQASFLKTASSLIFRIIIFFIFHNFMYISTNLGSGDTSVLTQSERINMLMSNCHPNDVRFKYRYFSPKHKVSILAYKEKDRLIPKKIDGFTFGGIVEGAKAIEDMIDPYPNGYDVVPVTILKIFIQFLILFLTFNYYRNQPSKRYWFITFIGSLVLFARMIIWKRIEMCFTSLAIVIGSLLGYRLL